METSETYEKADPDTNTFGQSTRVMVGTGQSSSRSVLDPKSSSGGMSGGTSSEKDDWKKLYDREVFADTLWMRSPRK